MGAVALGDMEPSAGFVLGDMGPLGVGEPGWFGVAVDTDFGLGLDLFVERGSCCG
jgi:hypothetical protein